MRYVKLRLLSLSFMILLTACPTGPGQNANSNPASLSFSLYDDSIRQSQNGMPAGAGSSGLTFFIAPGDEYLVVLQAASPSGIKSITMSGAGSVICGNNMPPYTRTQPFKYTIPATTITLNALPNGQVYTQASNPYSFLWGAGPTVNGKPFNGPTLPALNACGSSVPLLGTTTYTGTATTAPGVTSAPVSLNVTTCANPPCGG
jgi:hypothetical protein